MQPTAIHAEGELPVRIADGDAVVFMNFRADRARQITRAIINADFDDFERRTVAKLADFVMLTRYADDIDTSCAFEAAGADQHPGRVPVAGHGRTQLRIAETEKYAHVTFFFSGGQRRPLRRREAIADPLTRRSPPTICNRR